jgi:uncharacterized membrane protein YcaP (DUF421 family)
MPWGVEDESEDEDEIRLRLCRSVPASFFPKRWGASSVRRMWNLSLPWWEFVARGAIVYFFLLVLLRVTGKRQVGQLAPFDLVLLLILSNGVQNAMNGGDNSIFGGLILATTLVLLNHAVGFATFRSRKLEAMVEGRPQVLIRHGRVFQAAMDQQHITDLELKTALRNAGCERVEDVALAILETNGHVSVLKNDDAPRPKG